MERCILIRRVITGWLLGEAGKRDEARLIVWLVPRAASMPRTMLRYAIERLPTDIRLMLMQKKY